MVEAPRSEHCRRLIDVARTLLAALPDTDLRAAFLFGSAAWGDADEASDVDLMLLLNRSDEFRQVQRVRVADWCAGAPPPRFADIDRISAPRFEALVERGVWEPRIVNSVILRDDQGWFARIRARVTAAHRHPLGIAVRFAERRLSADTHRLDARRALLAGDTALARLHVRLAVQEAGSALIAASGDRQSTTHFVDSVGRALAAAGQGGLVPAFHAALALRGPDDPDPRPVPPVFVRAGAPALAPEGVVRGLAAYLVLAEALRVRMAEPGMAARFSGEDRAWADFTHAPETYAEIADKVASFLFLNRLPALQYYLDCELLVPVRINLSKVFNLHATGSTQPLTAPVFHTALGTGDPALFAAWGDGLRLFAADSDVGGPDHLASQLIRAGEGLLDGGGPEERHDRRWERRGAC